MRRYGNFYLQPRDGDPGPIAQAAPYCDFFEKVGRLIFTGAINLTSCARPISNTHGRTLEPWRRSSESMEETTSGYEMFEAVAMTQRRSQLLCDAGREPAPKPIQRL